CDGTNSDHFTIFHSVCDARQKYAPLPQIVLDNLTTTAAGGCSVDYCVDVRNIACVAIDSFIVHVGNGTDARDHVVPPGLPAGGSVVLNASGWTAACSVPLEYQWSDPTGVIQPWSASPVLSATPTATTLYTVEVRCPDFPTCVESASVTAAVVPLPIAYAGPDLQVCQYDTATLDGSGSWAAGCPGGPLYEWLQGPPVVRP